MTCWITTHWPVPADVAESMRHVYVKTDRHLCSVPRKGDIVLLYQAKIAKVHSKRVHKAELWRRRKPTEELLDVPVGVGGIIGRMTVKEEKRDICDDDVVLDYGNLREGSGFIWEIIPCHKWCPCNPHLLRGGLMKAIGKPRDTPPRFLSLYRVPDQFVPALLGLIA